MSESSISQSIRCVLSTLGARLFRNQVGRYRLEDGRWIRSGLTVGSSDLIGWHSVTVTSEMVGKKVAVFTAIEVKTPKGRVTKRQYDFLQAVKGAGGIGVVAREVADALKAVTEFMSSDDDEH